MTDNNFKKAEKTESGVIILSDQDDLENLKKI